MKRADDTRDYHTFILRQLDPLLRYLPLGIYFDLHETSGNDLAGNAHFMHTRAETEIKGPEPVALVDKDLSLEPDPASLSKQHEVHPGIV